MAKTSHLFNQKVVNYSIYWIVQIHELTVDNLSTYKELMTYFLCATPNTPQVMYNARDMG